MVTEKRKTILQQLFSSFQLKCRLFYFISPYFGKNVIKLFLEIPNRDGEEIYWQLTPKDPIAPPHKADTSNFFIHLFISERNYVSIFRRRVQRFVYMSKSWESINRLDINLNQFFVTLLNSTYMYLKMYNCLFREQQNIVTLVEYLLL